MRGRKKWKISESREEPRVCENEQEDLSLQSSPPLYFLSSPQQGKEQTRNNSLKRIPDSPQMGRGRSLSRAEEQKARLTWAEGKREPTRNQSKPLRRKRERKRKKNRVNPMEKCISTGFGQMMISNGTYKHHRPPENHKYNL
ncbi:hypothetical protein TNCV_587701 [Trichonephila clavipes]|nr:hypothetical protein TNCV_587701 [Trichonephila clavipes]